METLELQDSPSSLEAAPVVRLSKIEDYLADNFCVLILSHLLDWVQEQSGWPDAAGSKLGIRLPLYEQCHRDSLAFRGRMSLKRCDAAGICTSRRQGKAPPKRKLGRATLWIGTDWSAAQAVTPSFCRSLRNCSASFIWMTCIPSFAALSRFSGRSSMKQHSSGGRCVISRARR